MSVRKKGNKWYYRFMIDGIPYERAAKGATNQKDAEKCGAIAKAEIMHGNYNFGKSEITPKLKDALKIFEDYSKNNKLSYKSDVYYIKRIRQYFGDNFPLKNITPAKIEDFKAGIRFKNVTRKIKKDNLEYPQHSRKKYIYEEKIEKFELANSTINRHIEVMSKMFNLCIDNKLMKENPCRSTSMLREENFKIRYLTEDEQKRLFENIKEPYLKDIVKLALLTGMRKGEILGLKWENISNKYIELLNTKSGKPRKIPLEGALKDLINSIAKSNKYVFFNTKTNDRFVDIKKQFDTALKNAKITNFRFHDLRHTAATRMVAMGIDLVAVKEILGHQDIKTTMRYAHPMEQIKQKAINALGTYFNK